MMFPLASHFAQSFVDNEPVEEAVFCAIAGEREKALIAEGRDVTGSQSMSNNGVTASRVKPELATRSSRDSSIGRRSDQRPSVSRCARIEVLAWGITCIEKH